MNLSLHHHPSYTVVAVEGRISGASVEGVVDLFAMVPPEHPLVVDLTRVSQLDNVGGSAVRDELRARSSLAPLAVVVSDDTIALQLVLLDLDRCAALVRDRDDAITLVTGVLAGRS